MEKQQTVYEIVTENVLKRIEAAINDGTGTAPWHKPWTDNGAPRNFCHTKTL